MTARREKSRVYIGCSTARSIFYPVGSLMARCKWSLPRFNGRTITIAASLFLAGHAMAAQTETLDPKQPESGEYTGPHGLVNASGHCAKLEFKLSSGETKVVFIASDSVEVTDTMTHHVTVPVTFYEGENVVQNGNELACEGEFIKVKKKKIYRRYFALTEHDAYKKPPQPSEQEREE